MENASKALIIAGAAMAIMCLIQIAVMVYNGSAEVVERTSGQIDTLEVELHNNTFLMYYENTITGEQLADCISKAILNNHDAMDTKYKMTITVNNTPGSKPPADLNQKIEVSSYMRSYGYVSVNPNATYSADIRKKIDKMSIDISTNAKYEGYPYINENGVLQRIDYFRVL